MREALGRESRGFIDGDLVERLLDLPRSKASAVAKAMNSDRLGEKDESVTVEEIQRRVEALSRLH